MPSTPRAFEAKILKNRPLGGYWKLVFEDAEGALAQALPGQFVNLRLQPGYSPLLRRPFSIARILPGPRKSRKIEVLYAILRGGTRLLSGKKPGESINVLGPLGRPFPHLDRSHPALIVSGGIGVAPLIFLSEALKARKIPQAVFLGARTGSDLVELDVFKKLKVPLALATDDGSMGRKGFVTQLLDEYLASGKAPKGSVIHACGPRPMFKTVAKVAAKHGVKAYLSWEEHMACGLGICLTCACPVDQGDGPKMVRTCVEGPAIEASQILWDRLEN